MIEGIACSADMRKSLFGLPCETYRRVEAALRRAFAAPALVQEYANIALGELELHFILSEDVLFLLGDSRSKIQLL